MKTLTNAELASAIMRALPIVAELLTGHPDAGDEREIAVSCMLAELARAKEGARTDAAIRKAIDAAGRRRDYVDSEYDAAVRRARPPVHATDADLAEALRRHPFGPFATLPADPNAETYARVERVAKIAELGSHVDTVRRALPCDDNDAHDALDALDRLADGLDYGPWRESDGGTPV